MTHVFGLAEEEEKQGAQDSPSKEETSSFAKEKRKTAKKPPVWARLRSTLGMEEGRPLQLVRKDEQDTATPKAIENSTSEETLSVAQKITQEILQTERDYVSDLDIVIQVGFSNSVCDSLLVSRCSCNLS